RGQSDTALKTSGAGDRSAEKVASQHCPLPCSCTRSGSTKPASDGSGTLSPLALRLIFALPASPVLSDSFRTPSGVRSLSAYLNPVVPVAFQHGFVRHVPPAGACRVIRRLGAAS